MGGGGFRPTSGDGQTGPDQKRKSLAGKEGAVAGEKLFGKERGRMLGSGQEESRWDGRPREQVDSARNLGWSVYQTRRVSFRQAGNIWASRDRGTGEGRGPGGVPGRRHTMWDSTGVRKPV